MHWARKQRLQTGTIQLRELAHATCMAIGSEVARSLRGSFKDVMSVLRRVELDLAASLRGTDQTLEAIAA